MVLKYYEGQNFGDAINPIIFNQLLPGFFDNDETTWFLGIGSTLGFIKGDESIQKIIVFSTGFAYDQPPLVDHRYEIRCVRGPLTAAALKIDPKYAVLDGAVLLRSLPEFKPQGQKKYKFSFIPHHMSEEMFDRWEIVFNDLGVNFISPRENHVKVIKQIQQSECVLAEAMHGAIIADCFRVPWIPVKMFEHINDFKWKDWTLSLEMEYNPRKIMRLYNYDWIKWVINDKLKIKENTKLNHYISSSYKTYQNYYREKKFKHRLKAIMYHGEQFLSRESVLHSKESQLLEVLDKLKRDYSLTSLI